MARFFSLSKLQTAYRAFGAKCCENPMKVNSAIFIVAESLLGANPFAGPIWRLGCACAIAGHSIAILFGKGGEKVEASAFKVSLKGLAQTGWEMITMPVNLLRKSFWAAARQSFEKSGGIGGLWQRARHAPFFWRYPVEFGWVGFGLAGGLYILDSLIHGPSPRWAEAAIGTLIFSGSAMGFSANNPKLAGNLYSLTSCLSLVVGCVTHNPALVKASLAFWLANYTYSRVNPERQSAHTIRQAAPAPAPAK